MSEAGTGDGKQEVSAAVPGTGIGTGVFDYAFVDDNNREGEEGDVSSSGAFARTGKGSGEAEGSLKKEASVDLSRADSGGSSRSRRLSSKDGGGSRNTSIGAAGGEAQWALSKRKARTRLYYSSPDLEEEKFRADLRDSFLLGNIILLPFSSRYS